MIWIFTFITFISSACSSYAICKHLWPTWFWGMLGYDSYNLSDGSVGNWLQTQAVHIIFYSLNSQIPTPHIQTEWERRNCLPHMVIKQASGIMKLKDHVWTRYSTVQFYRDLSHCNARLSTAQQLQQIIYLFNKIILFYFICFFFFLINSMNVLRTPLFCYTDSAVVWKLLCMSS